MAQSNKEEIIMSSSDNEVTLTNHRIIHRNKELNKEVLLKDFLSYEVVRKRMNYYKVLAVVFSVPTIILFLLFITDTEPFHRHGNNGAAILMIFLFIVSVLAVLMLYTSTVRHLKIRGKHNEIEFPINDFSDESLFKFLNRLTIESENAKREG